MSVLRIIGIFIITICVLMTVASTRKAECRDVSSEVKYSHLVNQRIQLNEDFLIHAVTGLGNSRGTVDYYVITTKPGFGGPEVVFRETLSRGSELYIRKVMECNNCLFSWGFDNVRMVVVAPKSKYTDYEMQLVASFGGHDILENKEGCVTFLSSLIQRVSE